MDDATPFTRTLARLLSDQGWVTAATLVGTVTLLTIWLGWLVRAQVTLYAVSTEARVELDAAAYPIVAPLPGRVIETRLFAGRTVHRDETLVEIDATPERLQFRREEVRAAGISEQRARLLSQIAAEAAARMDEQESARLSVVESRNRMEAAMIWARDAEAELSRLRTLHEREMISTRELEKAEAEAAMRRAAASALQAVVDRIPRDQAARDGQGTVRAEGLHREVAALEAEQATGIAEVQRLGYEIERRQVRSPVTGRIAEAATLRLGAVVAEGERLGSVLPAGGLMVVAQYAPADALGRITAGDAGRLRLAAFPWAEFGAVAVRVTHVAEEIRNGSIRVELAVDSVSGFRDRLGHGMPGTVEIEVERLPPLALLLRIAGQWLTVNR